MPRGPHGVAPERDVPRRMKPHAKIIDRIIEALRQSQTVCVAGHVRPDGDCVGSQLGLTLALRNEGKRVVCWNEDRIPQKYEFLDRDGIIQKPKKGAKFDCVVATAKSADALPIASSSSTLTTTRAIRATPT